MRRNLRWGIMGTANIAKKIWRALAITGNSVLAGVASRDAARCQRFISECQREVPMPLRPAAYGSYEEMLQSGDIDAVYIPLPTGIRADWVNRAAEAGKHVLCEKPCANSVPELERMLSVCPRRKVQF